MDKTYKDDKRGELFKTLPYFILADRDRLINTTYIQSMEYDKTKECVMIYTNSNVSRDRLICESVCKKHNLEMYNTLHKLFATTTIT